MDLDTLTTPKILHDKAEQHWQNFLNQIDVKLSEKNQQQLKILFAVSDYVADIANNHPNDILDLIKNNTLEKNFSQQDYHKQLTSLLSCVTDEATLGSIIRNFRRQQMLRIIWRDILQLADLKTTVTELSDLADTIIMQAYQKMYGFFCKRYGTPLDNQGDAQHLLIIAVGKLGGHELNLSSDVDLIFAFPQLGEIKNLNKTIAIDQFFTKLARSLIKSLEEKTIDGFVYRVDMRLRPYGDSGGQLVYSLNAMESYYQQQGRVWERYALIKARVINHHAKHAATLAQLLNQFVYRRYVDFSVIEALRDLKTLITQEVKLKQLQHDIKRGAGGIREIEFVIQVFQLMRGGQDKHLQQVSLLVVLPYLSTALYLNTQAVAELQAAYTFFRHIEHRLQAVNDQQTHSLPQDEIGKARLYFAMGFADYASFEKQLQQHIKNVQQHFDNTIAPREENLDDTHLTILSSIWALQVSPEVAQAFLGELGFQDSETVYQLLESLHHNPRLRHLSGQAAERLRLIMPQLLLKLSQQNQPDLTLQRILPLLETILLRSAYLALLVENPHCLNHLVTLSAKSAWIAELIAKYPIVLDELLDPRILFSPIDQQALQTELNDLLRRHPHQDIESQLNCLREFKYAKFLRIASCQISQAITAKQASTQLSELAATLLNKVLAICWHELLHKYDPNYLGTLEPDIAIIAYGKLGSFELNYNSDLDLVFIYDQTNTVNHKLPSFSLSATQFYTKLAQKMIRYLTAKTVAGILYEVDMRLRPSGQSGLLVASLSAFADYQVNHAWTWEHQALTRARVIYAPNSLIEQFAAVKASVLCKKRNLKLLREDVNNMREQMRKQLNRKSQRDLKQMPGGLIDIEFIVQYLLLTHTHQYPELNASTDNLILLTAMQKYDLLTLEQYQALTSAYHRYHEKLLKLALQNQQALINEDLFERESEQVIKVWDELFQ